MCISRVFVSAAAANSSELSEISDGPPAVSYRNPEMQGDDVSSVSKETGEVKDVKATAAPSSTAHLSKYGTILS